MWEKILGGISFLLGLLILIFFPDMLDYQSPGMGTAGAVVGLGLLVLGIYLLKT